MPWFLVMSRSRGDSAERDRHFPAHQAWLDDQHRAGRILFSGPTVDRAYGMYVVVADSLDEAAALAGEDPFHAHDVREMTLLPWEVRRYGRLDGRLQAFLAEP